MLKYHLLQPQCNKHHHAQFIHYLSLGSHESPYTLNNLASFSIITLNPKESFPEISENQNIAVLLLKGCLKIDSLQVSCDNYEKQNLFYNVTKIVNQSQNAAIFAFIRSIQVQIKKIGIHLYKTTKQQAIQLNNSLIYLVNGKFSCQENESQFVIKNTFTSQRTIPVLYAIEPVKIKIPIDSLYLQISDIL